MYVEDIYLFGVHKFWQGVVLSYVTWYHWQEGTPPPLGMVYRVEITM